MYNTNTVRKKLKKSKKNQPLINDLSGSPDFFLCLLGLNFFGKKHSCSYIFHLCNVSKSSSELLLKEKGLKRLYLSLTNFRKSSTSGKLLSHFLRMFLSNLGINSPNQKKVSSILMMIVSPKAFYVLEKSFVFHVLPI